MLCLQIIREGLDIGGGQSPLPTPTYNFLGAYKLHTLEIGTKRKKRAFGRLIGRKGDCREGQGRERERELEREREGGGWREEGVCV